MELFVVRHGDFAHDGELSEEGRGQALAAGKILRGVTKKGLVVLLCSPTRRAQETAKIIGEVIRRLPDVSSSLSGLSNEEVPVLIRGQKKSGTGTLVLVGHQSLLWLVSLCFGGRQERAEAEGLFQLGSVVQVDLGNGTIKVMS